VSKGTYTFSRKTERVIANLLVFPTLREASIASGLSERTLRRMLANRAFAKRYAEERARQLGSIATVLRQSAMKTIRVLEAVRDNKKMKPAARVAACRALLGCHFRASEQVELESLAERIEAIEARERQHANA
jgi:hypothetical protein